MRRPSFFRIRNRSMRIPEFSAPDRQSLELTAWIHASDRHRRRSQPKPKLIRRHRRRQGGSRCGPRRRGAGLFQPECDERRSNGNHDRDSGRNSDRNELACFSARRRCAAEQN